MENLQVSSNISIFSYKVNKTIIDIILNRFQVVAG